MNTTANPKITILLTSYNHGDFLRESIESVLNQTFTDYELIIVDDCSTDNSFDIIKTFDDPRITSIRNKRNMGAEYAFEILHSRAKGEYIAIADSDNVWVKDKLEKQVEFLDSNSAYTAVFTKATIIDELGKPYTNQNDVYFKVFDSKNRTRQEWLNYFFYKGNCLCHPSILIRKEAYKECGMTVNALWQIPDYYKWIKLCLKKEIFILDEPLINFRIHQNNISGEGNISATFRANNELTQAYSLFYGITKEDLLISLPESERYLVNGEIDIDFAISKLLLTLNIPAVYPLAVNKLFSALNNKEQAEKIYRLYKYDSVSFRDDETKFSPISAATPYLAEHKITSKLYLDFGDGFNEENAITIDSVTKANNTFALLFEGISDFCGERKPLRIRFDPSAFPCEISLNSVTDNLGNQLNIRVMSENYPPDAFTSFEGYDVFYSDDPAYIIEVFDADIESIKFTGKISHTDLTERITELNRQIQIYRTPPPPPKKSLLERVLTKLKIG